MYKNRVNKKIKKKRSLNKIINFVFFLLLPLAIFVGALLLLLNAKSFEIKETKISGAEYLNLEKIEKIVDKNLSGKNLFFIKNKNFLFYPESNLKKELKENFIEIKNVDISYKNIFNFNKIDINIEQKDKKYLWCESEKKEKCSFVSNSGAILMPFDRNKTGKKKNEYIYFLGKLEEVKKKENSGSKKKNVVKEDGLEKNNKKDRKKVEKIFLNNDDFGNLEKTIEKLSEYGVKIKNIEKIELGDYIVRDKNNIKIILPKKFSEKTIENFKNISNFKDVKFSRKTGEFSENLEYINFLFNKSIVYCLKKDVCVGNY